MTISMVKRCHQTDTVPITFEDVSANHRADRRSRPKKRIEQILSQPRRSRAHITGDRVKAKEAIAALKKLELPGSCLRAHFKAEQHRAD